MAIVQLQIDIHNPIGDVPEAGETVKLRLVNRFATGGVIYEPRSVFVDLDAQGEHTQAIVVPDDNGLSVQYAVAFPATPTAETTITVPGGAATRTLASLYPTTGS